MKYAILALALILLAYLVMDFNSRTAELSNLTAEQKIVRQRLEERQETQKVIQMKIAYATSEAAVYEWAYENHLVRPGDIPVAPVQSVKSTSIPTAKAVATETPVSNLEKWLMLFFDQPE